MCQINTGKYWVDKIVDFTTKTWKTKFSNYADGSLADPMRSRKGYLQVVGEYQVKLV